MGVGVGALNAGDGRGAFYDCNKSGTVREEKTKYTGTHWVECFVVKENVCVARSGEFVVNIVQPVWTYPAALPEEAVKTVLQQAELLCADWSGNDK